ncbi:MAG: AAA family ATPase [Clostridiaceae bacterium]|nr:AAA family ATPase [Clostridiaceae bacterium]
MATAKKATLEDVYIKIMVWGAPGCYKSRFGLSSPSPLVIDYEGSTRLYSNEFDFYVANVNKLDKDIDSPVKLTKKILDEILAGEYKDRKTLVVDPVTDLLDNLESICATKYEQQIGKKIDSLNQLQKTKWYAFRRETSRNMLDQLKDLPMNLILIARSKSVWGKKDGETQPIGETYDALDIVESLMDVVINLQKDKQDDIKAYVKKSRLGNLPDILEVKGWSSITKALEEANTPKEHINPFAEAEENLKGA